MIQLGVEEFKEGPLTHIPRMHHLITSRLWLPGIVPLIRADFCRPRRLHAGAYLLLSAAMSMFPSLMSSLMNLLVRSSSISWHLMRSLKSGLSRKESLNSSVGSPMVARRQADEVPHLLSEATRLDPGSAFSGRREDFSSRCCSSGSSGSSVTVPGLSSTHRKLFFFPPSRIHFRLQVFAPSGYL